MSEIEKTLHIEFGQLIDKMNNGLIHPHTTRTELVNKAMEAFNKHHKFKTKER